MSWSFPDFVERTPWLGPDLQTLRNALLPRSLQLSGVLTQRLTLPLDDGSGDALSVSYHRPATDTSRPLVVLIHGLSGTEDSTYMIASARLLLRRGHPVARLNLRGAGPSRPLCRLQYHAGRTKDLRAALRSFAAHDGRVMRGGLLLVGYSLGANMLLKFLAEYAGEFPVHGAASISAPIDLAAASRRFLDTRNRIYHWRLLRYMKIEALGRPDAVTDDERRCILAAGSIYEYDDRFVAPRNGYASAEEYYHANMARRFLADIRHPTLIIHAQDDPWIPADAYTSYPWNENPYLIPLLPRGGGHVGFHGRGSPSPWYDRCLEIFFDRLATRTENADNSREAFTPRRERAAQ